MNFKTVIPDRYNDKFLKFNYKFINVYEIYKDYVKLLVVDRHRGNATSTVLLDKNDFYKVSEFHWGGTNGSRPPSANIDKNSMTIGKYISGSIFRICGKIKGVSLWDLRQDRYSATGNDYVTAGKDKMKLNIYRRESSPFSVIFDKEDYSLLTRHIWRVEKDTKGTFSVISRDNNKQLSMHSYLLKVHGQKPGNKGFRNIVYKDYQFDFRKSVLIKKHALNIYTTLNSTTVELTINSVHGPIKIIFDKKDFEKVLSVSWVYKLHGQALVIRNYKHGLLKQFILGSIDKKFRYIDERKDKFDRFDFRKKTLLKCLR
jgi:hypothetical protein